MTNNALEEDENEGVIDTLVLEGEVDILLDLDESSDDEASQSVDSESIQDVESAEEEKEAVSSDSDDEAEPALTLPSWLTRLIGNMDDESTEAEISDAEASDDEIDIPLETDKSADEIDIPLETDKSADLSANESASED